MARGVWTFAESADEAREQIQREVPEMRVLRVAEIDLSGLPPLPSGPLPRQWVVVVEHPDPDREAELPQHEDPERESERAARQHWLALATDPDLLSTGTIEGFACPSCQEQIRFDLPPSREIRYPLRRACPHCRTPLIRRRNHGWEVAPPEPKRDPNCVFCGGRADSKEHVIPEWISKRLGIREVVNVGEALTAGVPHPRRRPISFASYRAMIFCSGCNEHFKHLEDEVIPLLVPMARALNLTLDAGSQALLALWANKTAIALSSAQPGPNPVPLLHREIVRNESRVAPDTWVGYFSWGGGGSTFGTAEPQIVERRSGATFQGYMACLAFGQVGFVVVGLTKPPGPGHELDAEAPFIRQFAPPKSPLLPWPSGPRITSLAPVLGFVPIRPVAS